MFLIFTPESAFYSINQYLVKAKKNKDKINTRERKMWAGGEGEGVGGGVKKIAEKRASVS